MAEEDADHRYDCWDESDDSQWDRSKHTHEHCCPEDDSRSGVDGLLRGKPIQQLTPSGLRPRHHVFQGAFPFAHSSSRCCLSRSVSIACQKPRWKKACTSPALTSASIGSRSNIW